MAAPWRQALQQSLEKNPGAPSKFFQLATVRPDGRPANRTVVYRGFEGDTDRLLFTTDTRSRKMEDFRAQPWAEVCWYFTETREQWRLNGRMDVVDASATGADQQLREENWKQMSGALRSWFAGPPPSAPAGTGSEGAEGEPSASDPPTPSFAVVRLDVSEVDFVDLTANKRQLFSREGGAWSEQPLNP